MSEMTNFQSDSATPHSGGRGRIILAAIILVTAAATAAVTYLWRDQKTAVRTPASTPTPAASGGLDRSLQDVDASLGDLNAHIGNIDSALADKPGDLSE